MLAEQRVFLKVYRSEKLVTSQQFSQDQISIGSSADGPSLVLKDSSVCFWHALIERQGAEYHISDLGSPTGTFVNSQPVLESPLKHGDQIKVGDFDIQFFINVPFVKEGLQSADPEKKSEGKKDTLQTGAALSQQDSEVSLPTQAVTKQQKPKVPPLKTTSQPEPPSQEDELESGLPFQEIQKEESFHDLDISDDFIRPLKKKSTQKTKPVAEKETGVSPLKEADIDVSPLKEKEVLPSSSFPTVDVESPPSYKEEQTLDVHPVPSNTQGTYAPKSAISDLDKHIPPGSGPIIEVTVAWKERVLSVHHFKEDSGVVTLGSDSKSDVFCPNLIGKAKYNLLNVGRSAVVYLSDGIKASLIDHKGKHSFEKLVEKGLITTIGSQQALPLNQSQLVRLDFSSSLRVYVRYSNRVQKAAVAGFFDFNFSEMMGLMMSFFFMSMLFFYLALFSPQFLDPSEDLEEAGIKKATIEFKRKNRVVKLKLAEKTRKKKTRLSIPHKQKVPRKRKKVGIKKQGSPGRLGQVKAKPKVKSKKKTITSARPGGSVTTKKSGAGPKSPRPDPTKVGLLGVFGKKGTQKQLDKAYSGTGELAGLAEQATGYAGQKESYTGEGIGTKFKNTGGGGKGSALIGVSSGIKTKGRGGGARGYGTGGSLGQRGRVQLELGTSDWEVEGGVDKDAILRVIRRNKHQLEMCYEFALQKKPDLEGKVLVQWNIVNERVRGVKVRRNTTNDSALARCLMSRLQNFRFTGTGLEKGQIGEVSIPFVVTKK